MSSPPTDERVLYSAKICPWAQRATLANIETGANLPVYEIDLQNKPSWYASAVNPASKVPVLKVGDVNIPESSVLLELFADLYPESKLIPEDALKRAEARYFIERFNQVVSTPYHANLLHGKEDSVTPMLVGLKEIVQLLNKYPGDYVLGERLSIADLGVLPFIGRILAMGKNGMLVGDVYNKITTDPAYKPFVDYANKMTSRPSFKATFDEDYLVGYMKKRVEGMRAEKAV